MKRATILGLILAVLSACEMTPEQEQRMILGLQRASDYYQRQQMLRQAQQPVVCNTWGGGGMWTTSCN